MARFEPEKLKDINMEFIRKPYAFIFPENYYKILRENPLFDALDGWTNSYAFYVTKGPEKYKDRMEIYFTEEEYMPIFQTHLYILKLMVQKTKKINREVYIFKMDIDPNLWHKIIKPNFEKEFENDDHVIFLWEK